MFTVNCIEKTKIKKKRPGLSHFKKTLLRLIISYASTVVSNDYKVFIIIAYNNCLIPK